MEPTRKLSLAKAEKPWITSDGPLELAILFYNLKQLFQVVDLNISCWNFFVCVLIACCDSSWRSILQDHFRSFDGHSTAGQGHQTSRYVTDVTVFWVILCATCMWEIRWPNLTLKLARWALGWEVRAQDLPKHFALTAPSSTQENKWAPVNFQESLMKC